MSSSSACRASGEERPRTSDDVREYARINAIEDEEERINATVIAFLAGYLPPNRKRPSLVGVSPLNRFSPQLAAQVQVDNASPSLCIPGVLEAIEGCLLGSRGTKLGGDWRKYLELCVVSRDISAASRLNPGSRMRARGYRDSEDRKR